MKRYRPRLSRDPMFWLGCFLFAVALVIATTLDWRGIAIYASTGVGCVAFLVWSERAR